MNLKISAALTLTFASSLLASSLSQANLWGGPGGIYYGRNGGNGVGIYAHRGERRTENQGETEFRNPKKPRPQVEVEASTGRITKEGSEKITKYFEAITKNDTTGDSSITEVSQKKLAQVNAESIRKEAKALEESMLVGRYGTPEEVANGEAPGTREDFKYKIYVGFEDVMKVLKSGRFEVAYPEIAQETRRILRDKLEKRGWIHEVAFVRLQKAAEGSYFNRHGMILYTKDGQRLEMVWDSSD